MFLLLLSCTLLACEQKKVPVTPKPPLKGYEHPDSLIFRKTIVKNEQVELELLNWGLRTILVRWIDGQEQVYDLKKLDIDSKVPGLLDWQNEHYAGVKVNWSGPFWSHVFVPLKPGFLLRHENQVYDMDEKNNTIIYQDTVSNALESYSVMNLVNNKKIRIFLIPIKNQDFSAPDSARLNGNQACIFINGHKSCKPIPDSILTSLLLTKRQ